MGVRPGRSGLAFAAGGTGGPEGPGPRPGPWGFRGWAGVRRHPSVPAVGAVMTREKRVEAVGRRAMAEHRFGVPCSASTLRFRQVRGTGASIFTWWWGGRPWPRENTPGRPSARGLVGSAPRWSARWFSSSSTGRVPASLRWSDGSAVAGEGVPDTPAAWAEPLPMAVIAELTGPPNEVRRGGGCMSDSLSAVTRCPDALLMEPLPRGRDETVASTWSGDQRGRSKTSESPVSNSPLAFNLLTHRRPPRTLGSAPTGSRTAG